MGGCILTWSRRYARASPRAPRAPQEVYEVALAYVKEAKLEEGVADKTMILLDAILCDALFKVGGCDAALCDRTCAA